MTIQENQNRMKELTTQLQERIARNANIIQQSSSKQMRLNSPVEATGMESNATRTKQDDSGVRLTLSRDAQKMLNKNSAPENNLIADAAPSKPGSFDAYAMDNIKTNILNNPASSVLAQANSVPQALLSLLS